MRRFVTSQACGEKLVTYLFYPDGSCDMSNGLGLALEEGQQFPKPASFIRGSLALLQALYFEGHGWHDIGASARTAGRDL